MLNVLLMYLYCVLTMILHVYICILVNIYHCSDGPIVAGHCSLR